jgi:adenine-specific DNA-methyltransferase
VIKYLGSKRRLLPVLGDIFEASGATTALDAFTGTTRVAQEFCRRGAAHVTAVDTATYSEVLARCYVELDAATADLDGLPEALAALGRLPGRRGFVTETFCERSRYFHPDNGMRIDAIRDAIEEQYAGHRLHPVLLTSLLQAADRVDSTVGLQMAYLKQWAPRALQPLALREPQLTPGTGAAVRGDIVDVLPDLPAVDLAYLDPPYNQHRYFTNYHVWETLVRWDAPQVYGVACKRVDSRDPATASVFNRRRDMPAALAALIADVAAEVVVVSFSDEGFVPLPDLVDMCAVRGDVAVHSFEQRRHVGASLGVYNPAGVRVGTPGPSRNLEHLVVAGPPARVRALSQAVAAGPRPSPARPGGDDQAKPQP